MKREYILSILLVLSLLSITSVSAANEDTCNLEVSLYNQDPYPAILGEYVKLVFKVEGLEDSTCGSVYFELVNDFPLQFDPGANKSIVLNSGAYLSDYENYALIPFKVKLSQDAIENEYEIKIKYKTQYSTGSNLFITKRFNLTASESKTDFELTVKDYDFTKQIATFEIINIGKNNVASLVVDLPKQENFEVKGSERSIIGSLDSNDDTSFTFEGIPHDGTINMKLSYNDDQGIRRKVEKQVLYDNSLFTGRIKDVKKPNYTAPVVLLIIVVIVIYSIIRGIVKRRKLDRLRNAKR